MNRLSWGIGIEKRVNWGEWQPIQISRDGPSISHLLFADDVLLFSKASVSQARVVLLTWLLVTFEVNRVWSLIKLNPRLLLAFGAGLEYYPFL